MGYAKIIFGLLGFAATLCAADPFVGKWKMNPDKSKYLVGTPPREQIVTITETSTDLQVKVEGVTADGTKTVVFYTIPLEGGMGKMFETSPAYDGISGKHLGPYEREISRLKDGKAVFTARSTVSKEGNSMAVHSQGVSPLGKPVDAYIVYDKLP